MRLQVAQGGAGEHAHVRRIRAQVEVHDAAEACGRDEVRGRVGHGAAGDPCARAADRHAVPVLGVPPHNLAQFCHGTRLGDEGHA